MVARNLADPEYEPTDEELSELMHRAFEGVAERRVRAEQELRARIARAREEAKRAFERRVPGGT